MRVSAVAVSAVGLLSACGGVQVAPAPKLPRALIAPLPGKIGVVVAGDMRNYSRKETRAGVSWSVALGPGHLQFSHDVFSALFRDAEVFADMASARAATGLVAIIEPRIENYSFATSQETGGSYFAVTIRYRFDLTTPKGEPVDSYTLTGYGNSLASGMGSGAPLNAATQSAMRDAAAKFLVQFPEQPAAKLLAQSQPLLAQVSSAANDPIEAVAIK